MNVVELVIDQCAEKKHIFLLMQSVRKKRKKKKKNVLEKAKKLTSEVGRAPQRTGQDGLAIS